MAVWSADRLVVMTEDKPLDAQNGREGIDRYLPPPTFQLLGVTQTSTGATNFPGAGLPTWTRSALTNSPVFRLKLAQGLGMRPKVIFWIGWPVAEFMMVATILMAHRLWASAPPVYGSHRESSADRKKLHHGGSAPFSAAYQLGRRVQNRTLAEGRD